MKDNELMRSLLIIRSFVRSFIYRDDDDDDGIKIHVLRTGKLKFLCKQESFCKSLVIY